MFVKLTFFFEGVQAANKYASASIGWTETFYGNSNTPTKLDDWLQWVDVQTYIDLRRACMPSNYRIAWLRVSDEQNVRSYKIKALNSEFGGAKPVISEAGAGQTVNGQVTCALLVDLARLPTSPTTEPTHHRKFLMRALPADVINGNVLNTDAPNWPAIKLFYDWLAFQEAGEPAVKKLGAGIVKNTSVGLKYQDPAKALFTNLPQVSPIPGDARAITVSGVIAANNDRVQFRRVPDSARDLNRIWRCINVIPAPAGATIFGRTKRDLQNATYGGSGTGQFRVAAPIYNTFSEYTIIGLRNKKTGKLFRQLRGRASAR